jgi:hypothetical protein
MTRTRKSSENAKTKQKTEEKYVRIGKSTNAPIDPCTLHTECVRPRFTNGSRRPSNAFQLAGILRFFSVYINKLSVIGHFSSPQQNRERKKRCDSGEDGTNGEES